MLHVALRYADRAPIGAFITLHDFRRVVAMRAAEFDGTVPALDAGGDQLVVVIAALVADPEVYGYGIELSATQNELERLRGCA